MTAKTGKKATAEVEIRKVIDDHTRAVRAKDVDRAVSTYSSEVVMFDVVSGLQSIGLAACRRRAEEWFSSFKGPIEYNIRDLKIGASDEIAFCQSLNQVIGTKLDGGHLDMWWRATVCYRKIEGRWTVVHEHNSVPFDPETGKALIDLRPLAE